MNKKFPSRKKNCVVFVANRGYALTSSRTTIIEHFLSLGWKVVVATADDLESQSLVEKGAYLEPVVFCRGGLTPLKDMSAFFRLREIYRKWKPVLIQHFHAKPVIFGVVAARSVLGNSVKIVNTITGLGNAFVLGGRVSFSKIGYRYSLSKADLTIFQNKDDRELFLSQNWVASERTKLIISSGVNLDRFFPLKESNKKGDKPFTVTMMGRLLKQKGVNEFIEVAKLIHFDFPDVKFLWAGEEDFVHPDAISGEWMHKQQDIHYLGSLTDIVPLLTKTDVMLFPSYYREGVPRTILEAAAMGIPVIGCDVPGVREAIRHQETGFLVQPQDAQALCRYLKILIVNKERRITMGQKARKMAEKHFDIRAVQLQYLQAYDELGVLG